MADVSMYAKFLRELPMPEFVPGPLFDELDRELKE